VVKDPPATGYEITYSGTGPLPPMVRLVQEILLEMKIFQ
jgi:hypothetical protein